MELVEPDMHLALTYIDAAARGGARLTVEDLDAYLERPERRRGGSVPLGMQAMIRSLSEAFSQIPSTSTPPESTVEYLIRVNWARLSAGAIALTPLGRAMLSFSARPRATASSDDPLVVQVDPTDPIAYLRVFDLIAKHGPGLLVDAYLDLARLSDVIQISEVNRVLTSDRANNRRLDLLGRLMADAPAVELRTVGQGKLHDRFFLPDDGPVYMLGSSLNSISMRPGVVIPIADLGAANAMRATYEQLWGEGSRLTPGGELESDVAP